jgi:hypothetical protein
MRSGGAKINCQERLIRNICRQLDVYNYKDVKRRLKGKMKRRHRNKYKRNFPTDRQIIRLISTVEWSRLIEEGGKKSCNRYEYVGETHPDSSAREVSSKQKDT